MRTGVASETVVGGRGGGDNGGIAVCVVAGGITADGVAGDTDGFVPLGCVGIEAFKVFPSEPRRAALPSDGSDGQIAIIAVKLLFSATITTYSSSSAVTNVDRSAAFLNCQGDIR